MSRDPLGQNYWDNNIRRMAEANQALHASRGTMNRMNRVTIVIVLALLLVGALSWFGYANGIFQLSQGDNGVCTAEAKICPDGSAVGRAGPNCEFAECPSIGRVPNGQITSGESYSDFVKRVEREGTVRVIIGFKANTDQDALIRRIYESLAAAEEGNIDRFDSIPFISIFVNAEQLRRLFSDPVVTSIQEDIPAYPTE